jgi:FKBP-type peptidyl-prolyl cis-trans isomerase
MARANAGDKVMVHYTGSLEDGTIFGFSYEDEP